MLSAELRIGTHDARLSIGVSHSSVAVVGFWSAAATAVLIAAFDLTFGFTFAGVDGTLAAVAASLAIAPCFVVLMVALYHRSPEHTRVWTGIAVAFSIIYATLIILNYMLQLTVVRQNPQAYPWLSMAFAPDSAFWAFEVFGYLFMSLAAAFALPAMRGRLRYTLRWLFGINLATTVAGLAAYVITADPVHPIVLFGLGVWSALFLAGAVVIAMQFRGDLQAEANVLR